MPTPTSWPPVRPPIRPTRRPRWLFVILAIVAVLLLGGRTWLSYYVDALWFASLGYGEVFWKTLSLQWGIFVAFALATFLVLYGMFLGLKRAYLPDLPSGQTIWLGRQPLRLPVEPILHLIAIAASAILALIAAAVMMADWPTLALYWYTPAGGGGALDPIFSKPLNFYLFTLPAWQVVAGWLMFLAVMACLMAIFFALVAGGARAMERIHGGYRSVSWRGLSLALAFLLLMIALQVYLGRFALLFQDHTIFGGVTYTDAHVMLPGLLVLCVAFLVGAAIAVGNAIPGRRGRWLVAGMVPAVVCYLVVQVFAWYMSSFIVKPNELVREQPYIVNNIKWTRQAYGLDQVSRHEFPAEAGIQAVDAADNQPTLQNIRPVGLARPAGHPAADPGNPHLLRFSRYRHRPLRN